MTTNAPGSQRWTPSGTFEVQGTLPTPDSARGVSALERDNDRLRGELAQAIRERDEARALACEAAERAKRYAALWRARERMPV
jgi:hypothetical protein